MKKAILYLFFLGLFFPYCQVHATALYQSAGVKTAVHKIQNKKSAYSHKADLLNDYDDDFDDYDCDDCDDYTSSVKCKFILTPSTTNSLPENFECKSFCDKIYYHVNFSRLPRFNYISLRVLRL